MVEDKEQERSAKKRKNVAEVQNVSPFQPVWNKWPKFRQDSRLLTLYFLMEYSLPRFYTANVIYATY
jgi:hypothetical protein